MSFSKILRAMRMTSTGKPASFVLLYGPPSGERVTVGFLEFLGGVWTFKYDEEYKHQRELRPIEGFDDLERVYQSRALFPFFAIRIPDVDRQDVKRRLEKDHIKNPEPTDLLRIFG